MPSADSGVIQAQASTQRVRVAHERQQPDTERRRFDAGTLAPSAEARPGLSAAEATLVVSE
jgi:hypothetical protein